MSIRRVAAIAAWLMLVLTATAGNAGHHAVTSAGGTVAAGNLRLSYSIGQPVAGTVAAGDTVLSAGFLALFAAAPGAADAIFRSGFEP
jgi:hypothetical protein